MQIGTSSPERIGVAGDWHGNTRWAMHVINSIADGGSDVLLQLGDFGIWPGPEGRRYLDAVESACHSNGVRVYVTPGNHEDYDRIGRLDLDDDGLLVARDHVRLFPRGFRFMIDGWRFVSLGGAPSIDVELRVLGKSWWIEEQITDGEVAAVVAGGGADIMLAHDAPDRSTDTVDGIIARPVGVSPRVLRYLEVGRRRMTEAVAAVRPRLFLHGHYHVFDDTQRDGTRFVCLDTDGVDTNVVLLDLSAAPSDGNPELDAQWAR